MSMAEKIIELERRLSGLIAFVKRSEWLDTAMDEDNREHDVCAWCYELDEHAQDCEWVAALAAAEGK